MTTLIEQILTKLGLCDEPKIQSKVTELVRLLELRSSNIPSHVNEYGKIVLCADIAASILSIGFEKDHAMKLSGLRKSQYQNGRRLFEKLLEINRIVGIKDICVQLNLSGVNQRADELLALYAKVNCATENSEIDIKHPQYAAMAVFQACKMMKQKILKPKIMSFSNLRPSQWALLEHRWDKFLAQHYTGKFDTRLNKSPKKVVESSQEKPVSIEKRSKIIELEDYESWKQRMLQMAESKLNSQLSTGQSTQKATF